jgi:hypothetical protein
MSSRCAGGRKTSAFTPTNIGLTGDYLTITSSSAFSAEVSAIASVMEIN